MLVHARRAALVLLGVGAALQPARADVAVLAVAPPPGAAPELVAVAEGVRAELSAARPGVLDGPALRARMVPPDPAPELARLERAHDEARAAYVRGDHQGSARALRAIVERLEALPPGPEAFGQWTRAMLRLARTELNLGREQAARNVLAALLRAAPEVEVDRTLYPASFARAVDRARAELRDVPRRRLTITASAPGVRVYLDGRDVGTAPAEVEVPPGPCSIVGVRDGLRAGPLLVDVAEAGQAVLLDFALPEALRPDAGPGLAARPDDARLVAAAGALLSVEEVVVVSVAEEPDGRFAVGALHDLTRGARAREGRVRLEEGRLPEGGAAALARFLATGERASRLVEIPGERPALAPDPGALGLPAGAPGLPAGPAPASAEPRRPRTLGWVALGAGVASLGLAVVGALELRTASDRYADARRVRDSGPLVTTDAVRSYNQLVRQGDAARQDATAAWVGAAATAAATGILGWLNYRRTGEVGPFRF